MTPLPLTEHDATVQAYRLRVKHGIPYSALARVMGEYHGVWLSGDTWRHRCRAQGAPPAWRPHNVLPPRRVAL